jgi:predicted aspartyl protease
VEVEIDGKVVKMVLDTGAVQSVMSIGLFKKLGLHIEKIKPTTTKLRSYSGDMIAMEGVAHVEVEFRGRRKNLTLFVVNQVSTPLFGMSWVMALGAEFVLQTVSREVDIS